MTKRLHHRVALVTGAGNGLGRTHALELARHGARVIVNDLPSRRAESSAATVVDEIKALGGEALLHEGDVTRPDDMAAMAALAMSSWGRIDILVNNAGVLRDRSFAKLSFDDFRWVLEVHLMGAVHATKAVWAHMQEQQYGRIVMTTSSSGLYGNFGQSNYGAAKMALVGLMQTLALEGAKRNIRVNCLAPSAATAMTDGVLPPDALARLTPDRVSAGLLALVDEAAPTRAILLAGAGSFECAHVTMTQGIHLPELAGSAEALCQRLNEVADRSHEVVPASGWEQYQLELRKADALPNAARAAPAGASEALPPTSPVFTAAPA